MMTTRRAFVRLYNKPVLLAVLLAAVTAGALLAQSNQGSVTGTVTDASGGVVPNVKITAKEEASGTSYETSSSSAGTYIFPSMRIGTYGISAVFTGFKSWQSTGVVVQVNTTTSLNIRLEAGAITESVTVNASAPNVESDTSDIGNVVREKQVLDLPLALGSVVQAMRSPEAFVFLTPGVTGPGTASGNGGTFESKISGGQAYGTEVLLDGISTSRSENGSSFDETAPSVDALSEFRVTTSTLSAEMGRTTGGVESFVTKAGTNSYHGSAYDIFRNEDLDANSWFNNNQLAGRTGSARDQFQRPLDRQNDYGLTLGGPVRIPKVYNGKDKTFFFFSWEQYRQNQGGVSNSTVPTVAEKNGDFSRTLNTANVLGTNPCDGTPIFQGQIFDPSTTRTVNGVQCRTAFAGNKINPGLISPIAQKILTFYPDPLNANAINNYSLAFHFPILDTSMSVRIDQNISSKSKLFFTYNSRDNTRTSVTPVFDTPGGNGRSQDFFTHYLRFGHDYIFTPSLFNHLIIGFNRTNSANVANSTQTGNDWNQVLGIKGAHGKNFPVIGLVEGPTTWLGDDVVGDTIDNGLRLNDSVTWVRGRHTLTFGTDLRYQKYAPIDNSRTSGNYYFQRGQTAGTPLTNLSGNGIASFLLGDVHDSNLLQKSAQPEWLSSYAAVFAYDTFKVGPTLTVNFGLRWDVDVPRRERFGNTSNISLSTPNPGANGQLGALVFAGTGPGRSGNNNERWAETWMKDFGPRVGFAWSPQMMHSKTVVRGGYGIYYGSLLYADFGGFLRTGFQANPGFSSIDGFAPAFNISSGFPSFTPPPNLDPSQLNFQGPQYLDPTYGRPSMIQNWSIQIQQQLATDLILEVGYVGTHATHLHTNFDAVNSLTPNFLGLGSLLSQQISSPQAVAAGIKLPFASFPSNSIVAQALVPFPQYFGFNTDGALENLGQSTYNSLQASLQRRFHNGLNLLASYTWSKTLTDADSELPFFATLHGGGSAQNPFDKNGEKAISNQDVPHTFVMSYIYELPVGKGKKFLSNAGPLTRAVGGWSVSGIHRYQSGQPLSFCCGTGIPAFAGAIRFNQILSQPLYSQQFTSGHFNPVTDPMFNRAAFSDPNSAARIAAGGSYLFGTMTRTTGAVRMGMYSSEDFNLLKRTNVTEKVRVLLQISLINAFNRHVFNRPPDLNANDPQFGLLDTNSTLYPPRRLQLQLKTEW
ncbi:MAG: carboxypeptidase-like regulatory domain-containing protein [Acidobacteriia bacterium]|nr:carboxypeptidase-like regulatory domain-containing protein [Terriglobia bacterium]